MSLKIRKNSVTAFGAQPVKLLTEEIVVVHYFLPIRQRSSNQDGTSHNLFANLN